MYYNITDYVKQQIIDSNDIVDVIDECIQLKKAGANYNACCPFHREKTPSFVVSKQKQIYHCFGCNKSGDVIRFLMEYRNWTYIETIEFLADRAGIKLEKVAYSKEQETKNNLIKKMLEINKEAGAFFHKTIFTEKNPLDYLEKRNINKDIIKKFGIGYTVNQWDNLLFHLKSKGFNEEDIEKTGLILLSKNKDKYYDRFRNRIIFPIIDLKKNVIGFGGRVLDDSLPKYLNSPESIVFNKGYNLYGLNIARNNVKDKSFFLVEGYMDVIKMHVYGYDTAVAALGTSLTDNQIKLLKKYSNSFYLCFDSDEAGKKAALRAINMFKQNNLDAKVIIVKNAKDPDEFLNKYGKVKFDQLVVNALDYFGFLEYYYENSYNEENKIEYINNFYNNISNIQSDIEKELILDKLANKINISRDSIINDYMKKNKIAKKINVNKIEKNKKIDIFKTEKIPIKRVNSKALYEEELLRYIYNDSSLVINLRDIIYGSEYREYEYLKIFKDIYEGKISEKIIDREFIENLIPEEFTKNKIFSSINNESEPIKNLFEDCVRRFKIKYLEEMKNKATELLKEISDEKLQNEKLREIFDLSKKVKLLKEEGN